MSDDRILEIARKRDARGRPDGMPDIDACLASTNFADLDSAWRFIAAIRRERRQLTYAILPELIRLKGRATPDVQREALRIAEETMLLLETS